MKTPILLCKDCKHYTTINTQHYTAWCKHPVLGIEPVHGKPNVIPCTRMRTFRGQGPFPNDWCAEEGKLFEPAGGGDICQGSSAHRRPYSSTFESCQACASSLSSAASATTLASENPGSSADRWPWPCEPVHTP